jgi:2,4-dienoyl-CoA reductase-like NADH-dependent reductase (Old Yellow Enzyme family)/thioredoxin reductase
MAVDQLLREGRINRMRLPHRILTGPMERGLANRDGSLTARYIDYLTERARGGAGLIQVESTYIDPRGMGHLYQAGCHGDHVIPALARMSDAIHREGAKVALELYFGGRQTPSYMSQRQPLAPSVVECHKLSPVPTPRAMTEEDIQEIVEKFAHAARRVIEGGLDMIHLHGSHGYLLGSFLSPFSNRRSDRYGGSLENRSRFPLEVLTAVRNVVGQDFPIGYRLSADEYVEGGLNIEETSRFSLMLADGGIDLIDVSGGIYESGQMIIQGPEAPKGGFVHNAAAIKQAVGDRVPVSVAQRLNDPHFANEVLRRENLDFISLTRAFHADPHYVNKLKKGRAEEIIPCIACHHCTNLLEANLPAGCAANPQTAFERQYKIQPAVQPEFILVAGGGPAGMHAARMLVLQGHRVSLYEAGPALGGQMRYSARVAPDYGYLIDYLSRQMTLLGVDVHLNTPVDVALLRNVNPDAVVVATGACAGMPFFPLTGNPKLFDLFSALDREEDVWDGRTVIAGGDSESCFVGLYAAGHGAEVYIVEPGSAFSVDKLSPGRNRLMGAIEDSPKVRLRSETTVEEVGQDYVLLQKQGRMERLEEVQCVIVGGRTSNHSLYEAIRGELPYLDVYNIGDSVRPRDVYAASHEAAEAAAAIRLRAHGGGEELTRNRV